MTSGLVTVKTKMLSEYASSLSESQRERISEAEPLSHVPRPDVEGVGFRIYGVGFRVQGFEFRV